MQIAVLSDIHGNIDALTCILDTFKRERIEKLIVLGDIVGYYYHPDKVLDILSVYDFVFVRGNHEELLGKIINGDIDANAVKEKYGSGHEMAINKLNNEQLNFLVNAPDKIEIEVNGVNIFLSHASPWSIEEYIYPDSSIETLNRCLLDNNCFTLLGHTHYPFIYSFSNKILVNPGSVGQSRISGGLAAWAIINTENCSVQFRQTAYNTNKLLGEVERFDPEMTYMRDILKRK
jgi:putative phosphoesterase